MYSEIEKVRISVSKEPSSNLIPKLEEAERIRSEASGLGSMGVSNWDVVDKSDDVTGKLLKDRSFWYDEMLVCNQGHIINSSFGRKPLKNKLRCDKCGSPTITQCPQCGSSIRGDLHEPHYVFAGENTPPLFCQNCGAEFPWKKKVEKETDATPMASKIDYILQNFNGISRPLRNRKHDRAPFKIQNEYDVQDVLHVLLNVEFRDVRPEEWTPSYAGASSKVDFLLKEQKIVVEAKMTRDGLADKELGEELLVDIARYEGTCEKLICFIYDPDERIANRNSLKKRP